MLIIFTNVGKNSYCNNLIPLKLKCVKCLRTLISLRMKSILMEFSHNVEQLCNVFDSVFYCNALYQIRKLILPKPLMLRSYQFDKLLSRSGQPKKPFGMDGFSSTIDIFQLIPSHWVSYEEVRMVTLISFLTFRVVKVTRTINNLQTVVSLLIQVIFWL